MTAAIWAFVQGVLENLAASEVSARVRQSKIGLLFNTKSRYFSDLRIALKDMPFIYRDVGVDTRSGFVDVDIDPLNRDSLFENSAERFPRPIFDRLGHVKRGLFIGHAGIGKTTLFRFTVLALIDRGPLGRQLDPEEDALPIYVQLKAIDNSAPSPILRFIQKQYPYFSGSRGLNRLIRLARQTRIFLLLDGYDEVPFVGGMDYTIQELESLFASQAPRAVRHYASSEYKDVYSAFLGCRVWLSTRREFVQAYPIEMGQGAVGWVVKGIGRRRLDLVRRIFERHLNREPELWKGRLDAEYFVQELDRTAEGALIEMSRNPLFLTIMCFVYVHHLRDHQEPDAIWREGAESIVRRCIDALLVDIDASKARGLPDAERKALMGRRSAWIDEKRFLLSLLAGWSFIENKPLMSLSEMEDIGRAYFRSSEMKPAVQDVLRGLESRSGTSNICLQLIYSGLLVLARREAEVAVYDFPHRRFKEVLAIQYFDTEPGFTSLIDHLDRPHLADILVSFFHRTSKREQFLPELVRVVARSEGEASYRMSRLTSRLLELIDDYDLRVRTTEHLFEAVRQSPNRKRMPLSILGSLVESIPADNIALSLRESVARGDEASIALLGRMLREADIGAFKSLVEESWGLETSESAKTALLAELGSLENKWMQSTLSRLWPRGETGRGSDSSLGPIYAAALRDVPVGRVGTVKEMLNRHFLSAAELQNSELLPVIEGYVERSKSLPKAFEWVSEGPSLLDQLGGRRTEGQS